MGKRKIGEIYNKPIIEGDINLKTPNEIHKSELSGGGGNSSGEVKERWVSVDLSAINGGPVDFKEFNIYFKSELGYRILNELCDVFIGWAAIPYTSGDGYSISGGTMNIGELNNLRKGVDSEGRADKPFTVRAFKFREVNNSNKFIDIVAGNPQQPYKGGLGNLDTLSLYPILLNHNFWNNKNKEERLFLTITVYSMLVFMNQINENTLFNDLYNNNITIEDFFIQNGGTEEMMNMFNIIYINKEEELNKVIEYITNYNGFNN